MINKILLLIFIFNFLLYAQEKNVIKSDLKRISETTANYFKAPFKFNSNDLSKAGLLTSATFFSSLVDNEVRNFSSENFDSSNVLLHKFDSYYHIEFMSAAIVGLYLYGNISNKSQVRVLSVDLLSSSLLTGITTFAMKSFFGRSRPYQTDDHYEFNWFEYEDKFLSFPSGHTSLAFSFSTIMAEQNKTFLWKSIWFSAATLVGASRIYNNKHWFSDVVMGAIIGYVSAKFVLNQKINNSSDMNLPTNNIVIMIRL